MLRFFIVFIGVFFIYCPGTFAADYTERQREYLLNERATPLDFDFPAILDLLVNSKLLKDETTQGLKEDDPRKNLVLDRMQLLNNNLTEQLRQLDLLDRPATKAELRKILESIKTLQIEISHFDPPGQVLYSYNWIVITLRGRIQTYANILECRSEITRDKNCSNCYRLETLYAGDKKSRDSFRFYFSQLQAGKSFILSNEKTSAAVNKLLKDVLSISKMPKHYMP